MFYVYVLRMKKSGRYYIGQTQNLTNRHQKHSRGETRSMKNRGEFELVYAEGCSSRAEALKREKQIKSYKGGMAFKGLLADWDGKKIVNTESAEVPPLAG